MLGPIETTFRKYTFSQKIVFSIPTGPKTAKKWPKKAKNGQKKYWPKNFGFLLYRDLALAVPVVLAPSEAFFDFSFSSYSRFREGTPPMHNVLFVDCDSQVSKIAPVSATGLYM